MLYYFKKVEEFVNAYAKVTSIDGRGAKANPMLREDFIIQMINDELEEMGEARDETEKIDAALDIFYYCMNALVSCGHDVRTCNLLTEVHETVSPIDTPMLAHNVGIKVQDIKSTSNQVAKKGAVVTIAALCFNAVMHSGHDFKALFNVVHDANMTKFTLPGGRTDPETGKWLKPPGFVPPDEKLREMIENA